jgi:hypothetical protein
METTKVLINGWMNFLNVVYIYMEDDSAFKKKEILLFMKTWMNLNKLNELSHTQEDKFHMVSLICAIYKSSIQRSRK